MPKTKPLRKLKLYIAASLDGKIARPDGAIDWLPDPIAHDYGYQQFYDSIDTIIMGYKTYEICLSFGEWHYKGKKSYVFSRNAAKTCGPEAQLITRDPAGFVAQLKQEPGTDIWLLGGGAIITLLHEAGLIDEYIIACIPVILGAGIELFPAINRQQNLKLYQHQVYENGVTLLYLNRDEIGQ